MRGGHLIRVKDTQLRYILMLTTHGTMLYRSKCISTLADDGSSFI